MLNTLTKTKTSLKSVSFQKNLGYGGSWKAQWTNAFRTEIEDITLPHQQTSY
jgi:hypothetical protein